MKGAREYARIFNTGQHGRLYFVRGEHARGMTFHIWVLPSNEPISVMPWTLKDAVEVYGIVSGQPGWTETYGWLHRGPWEQDFYALVRARQIEIAAAAALHEQEDTLKIEAERRRKLDLLATYKA